jgi:hypothetical protein
MQGGAECVKHTWIVLTEPSLTLASWAFICWNLSRSSPERSSTCAVVLPLPPPPVAEAGEETRMGMRRKETKVAMIGQGFICQQQQDAIDISRLSFVAA